MSIDRISGRVFFAFVLVAVGIVLCVGLAGGIRKARKCVDTPAEGYRVVTTMYRDHIYIVWHHEGAMAVTHDPDCGKCLSRGK